jgi:hypothetical protein
MIGIDPHKGSHTAVAISAAEEPLGDVRVRAGATQAGAPAYTDNQFREPNITPYRNPQAA